jgi:hypothetical protein
MEQKKFYSHIPYSHNVPYQFFGRISVHFGRPRFLKIASCSSTVVDHSANNTKIEGSNPAAHTKRKPLPPGAYVIKILR